MKYALSGSYAAAGFGLIAANVYNNIVAIHGSFVMTDVAVVLISLAIANIFISPYIARLGWRRLPAAIALLCVVAACTYTSVSLTTSRFGTLLDDQSGIAAAHNAKIVIWTNRLKAAEKMMREEKATGIGKNWRSAKADYDAASRELLRLGPRKEVSNPAGKRFERLGLITEERHVTLLPLIIALALESGGIALLMMAGAAFPTASEPQPIQTPPIRALRPVNPVLRLIDQSGGSIRQDEITARMGWPKSTTSEQLSALEDQGLIKREQSGRTKLVTRS